ncbi:MAG: hypothetical protein A2176_06465 [Spirochaetes bacterium RBG_13_51_14]|nr:MAG: hypothetical protein A2176_06465 [Spirochaetes bacterium RBG_13_51_14]
MKTGRYITCVRFYEKCEDHQIPVKTPKGFLILENDGYLFQHNTRKDILIEIICSERYDIDDKAPSVRDLFQAFLNKIEFK